MHKYNIYFRSNTFRKQNIINKDVAINRDVAIIVCIYNMVNPTRQRTYGTTIQQYICYYTHITHITHIYGIRNGRWQE